MAGFPAAALGTQTAPSSGIGVKVASGESRFDRPLKLPEGNLLFIKVSSQILPVLSSSLSSRAVARAVHRSTSILEEDECFYCLAGEYIVEVGERRYELRPGDAVLGPRRVPHAFAFVGSTPGRLLVGFTPAGRMEQFFRDLDARGALLYRLSGGPPGRP